MKRNRMLLLCALAIGTICPAVMFATEGAGPSKEKSVMMHATGTFEVKTTPEAQSAAGAYPTARLALEKKFTGGLQGEAIGVMLSIGTPKPGEAAAYVAIDQFTGLVDGKKGSFALTHRASMTKQGTAVLEIQVVPDSGQGELAGIGGTLAIEVRAGVHHYDFAYSLPGKP